MRVLALKSSAGDWPGITSFKGRRLLMISLPLFPFLFYCTQDVASTQFKPDMTRAASLQVTKNGDPELYLWHLIRFLQVSCFSLDSGNELSWIPIPILLANCCDHAGCRVVAFMDCWHDNQDTYTCTPPLDVS